MSNKKVSNPVLKKYQDKIEENKKTFNVPDNCNAFRDWLDKNEIHYVANGSFTSFDPNQDIFSIGEQWGVYKHLNKPSKVSNESIGEDEAIKQAAYENCKLHYIMAFSDNLLIESTIDFEAGVEWQRNKLSKSKLEELEKWIDENKMPLQTFPFSSVRIDNQEIVMLNTLKSKIKSLKK